MAVGFVELLRRRWQKSSPHIDLSGLSLEEMWDALARDGAPPDYGDPDTDDLLEWLKERGPDDWHRSACTWNWDFDMGPMEWVLEQRECDAGTAITLFGRGEPSTYSQYASLDELMAKAPHQIHTARFLKGICERWANGHYRSYRFKPDAVWPLEPNCLPWPLPATLAHPGVQGELLDFSEWSEGFPPEAWIWS
jgi:hypothetical protein